MPRKLFNIALLAGVIALVAALGYWNLSPDGFNQQPDSAVTDNAIDFYATNTYTVQYQVDGKLHYELTADKVEHIKASDITLMTSPNMDLFRGTALPWKIRSERGEVSPGGTEVELIENVRVDRTDAKGRPTILTTSRLTVFPEKEYAQTQQAVRIVAANGVTTAKGMKAYMNDGRMLLLSNVRGQHEAR
ncbi:LPS export ABC transporter periplasmic protein LptC [Pseudomonas sp. MIL19]|uniref:LPS export ABC transporter periplasmic protein LptC n=1 Tax=Pseudomonas sp. MIL19 TaxID=2976979 RepID=UPI001E0B5821|nr:LPS export ABC transporter periplasmic protein LptC [Pseudomonas sp. MIL19]MBU0807148.1 LPS export ABC transporter periplasmic protein LptC [Gammaproteobacteria bacterium]MBU0885074.1 LPS export ABC transporter periplasmic protein LptC [Gammaproteobacteria bacterium]MBU1861645.1 LPS export ABC transporter periplasmic protein LptC [Gammaproteobacteria bacterium]MDD2159183.1 LPS export ABC transporter periplasmic protein LptC [Pseudomonas sp. MIL19]